jgi:hypothetical protein
MAVASSQIACVGPTDVVPSAVVADVLSKAHRAWLAEKVTRRDNPMRRLRPQYLQRVPGYEAGWLCGYSERWDYLTTDPRIDVADGATARKAEALPEG